jgi:hypothetical protein
MVPCVAFVEEKVSLAVPGAVKLVGLALNVAVGAGDEPPPPLDDPAELQPTRILKAMSIPRNFRCWIIPLTGTPQWHLS